ncbi:uncharacterized, partial [Tachysurus ichikawai]
EKCPKLIGSMIKKETSCSSGQRQRGRAGNRPRIDT